MSCDNLSNATDALTSLNGTGPVDAVVCPYVAEWGAGMPIGVFTMMVMGTVGLGVGIYQESPLGPIIVAILMSPLLGSLLPSMALKVMTFVMITGLTVGLYIVYSRSRDVL